MPFLDLAYQGFAEGLDADAAAACSSAPALPWCSCRARFRSRFPHSERVGALSIVTQDGEEAARVLSQVKRVIRTNYSSPPSYGSQTAAMVLTPS